MATLEDRKIQQYFLKNEFLAVEEIYLETADILWETISRFQTSSSSLERSTDSSIRDSNNNHFQLPRISLPKFSGKFSDWEPLKIHSSFS